MNQITPSAELLPHIIHPYKFLERVSKTLFNDCGEITSDTARSFIRKCKQYNQLYLLEHDYCYFVVHNEAFKDHNIWTTKLYDMVTKEKYLNWAYIADDKEKDALFISGSFRAFIECYSKLVKYMAHPLKDTYPEVFKDLQMKIEGKAHNKYNVCKMCTREEFIKEAKAYPKHPEILQICLPHTIEFTCTINMVNELRGHRPAAFIQEDFNGINYKNDRHYSDIAVVPPTEDNESLSNEWIKAVKDAEIHYMNMIKLGAKPEEAMSVLPLSTAVKMVVTATEQEWRHILNLRYYNTPAEMTKATGIRELMWNTSNILLKEFKGYDEDTILYEN